MQKIGSPKQKNELRAKKAFFLEHFFSEKPQKLLFLLRQPTFLHFSTYFFTFPDNFYYLTFEIWAIFHIHSYLGVGISKNTVFRLFGQKTFSDRQISDRKLQYGPYLDTVFRCRRNGAPGLGVRPLKSVIFWVRTKKKLNFRHFWPLTGPFWTFWVVKMTIFCSKICQVWLVLTNLCNQPPLLPQGEVGGWLFPENDRSSPHVGGVRLGRRLGWKTTFWTVSRGRTIHPTPFGGPHTEPKCRADRNRAVVWTLRPKEMPLFDKNVPKWPVLGYTHFLECAHFPYRHG